MQLEYMITLLQRFPAGSIIVVDDSPGYHPLWSLNSTISLCNIYVEVDNRHIPPVELDHFCWGNPSIKRGFATTTFSIDTPSHQLPWLDEQAQKEYNRDLKEHQSDYQFPRE